MTTAAIHVLTINSWVSVVAELELEVACGLVGFGGSRAREWPVGCRCDNGSVMVVW